MRVYLDNAATSAKKPFLVYKSLFKNTVFNSINSGRGSYKKSIDGILKMMDTKESIAELFDIEDISRISFTQNATYALNFAILGFLKPHDHVVITSLEHNSVLRPVHRHGNYTVVEADNRGNINPDDVERAICDNTRLLICTHASNVCGTIEPVFELGKIAKSRGIKFLVDAAQTAGIVDINVFKMNIDMLAFSGHKGLMGPLGTGGLYVSEKVNLEPLIVGGTGSVSESFLQPDIMPDKLESGTQNTPAITALKYGVDFVKKHREEIFEKERSLAIGFIEDILNINGVSVYGNFHNKRNGTVAFNIDGTDSSAVSKILEERFGILTRAGFHCSPLAHKTLGTSETGAVRVSFGFFNSKKEVEKLTFAINKIRKNGYTYI